MSLSPIAFNSSADQARILNAVVDTTASIMVGLRPDHTIFAWNKAAEALYQTPKEAAFDVDYVATFIAPEHRAAVAADITRVLAGQITMNFEDDSILPDGRRRTLVWNVTRVVDATGETFGILAVGQDITERKEAEDRFRLVFEHVQDGLLLSDQTGVIDCNPGALRLLGLTDKSQLIGRRPSVEFSPALQPDGTSSDEKSRALGVQTAEAGALRFEWMHADADGREVPVEVSVRHAAMSGRRISVVSWHDLTDRREAEAERARMQERLDLAQKMEAIGQLAGGVAHDFNNLLTAMRNAVELAQQELVPGCAAHTDLSLALEAANRATGLTRQLLAFSRNQAVRVEAIDFSALVRETMPLLRTTIPASVQVHVAVPQTPTIVRADRSQLEQIVMNLVLNARDAMPNGGKMQVSVATDPGGQTVRLSVRDSGTGMDAATQRRIFEPFFTTKAVGSGTGLGLSVVYGAVAQAGGQVTVESTLGAGSTFDVALPLAAAMPDKISAMQRLHQGNNRLALLVDDEPAVRNTTQRLLQRLGWRVMPAVDGLEGWELYQQHAPDLSLVMTDVRMPRLDGLRLAQRIRGTASACPLLVFSGYDSVDGQAASSLVDVQFLAKPFDLQQLAAALEAAVHSR